MNHGGTIEGDPADPPKKTSVIAGPTRDEATVQLSEIDWKCSWNGVEFECSYGKWVPID